MVVVDIDVACLDETLVGACRAPQNKGERLAFEVGHVAVVVVYLDIFARLRLVRAPPASASWVAVGGENVYSVITRGQITACNAYVLGVHRRDAVTVSASAVLSRDVFYNTVSAGVGHNGVIAEFLNSHVGYFKAVHTVKADRADVHSVLAVLRGALPECCSLLKEKSYITF